MVTTNIKCSKIQIVRVMIKRSRDSSEKAFMNVLNVANYIDVYIRITVISVPANSRFHSMRCLSVIFAGLRVSLCRNSLLMRIWKA